MSPRSCEMDMGDIDTHALRLCLNCTIDFDSLEDRIIPIAFEAEAQDGGLVFEVVVSTPVPRGEYYTVPEVKCGSSIFGGAFMNVTKRSATESKSRNSHSHTAITSQPLAFSDSVFRSSLALLRSSFDSQ